MASDKSVVPATKKSKTLTLRIKKDDYRLLKAAAHNARRSLNSLIVEALRDHLTAHRRAEIDAAFAGMGTDSDYQREALTLEGMR